MGKVHPILILPAVLFRKQVIKHTSLEISPL